jgi:hypothetical protein
MKPKKTKRTTMAKRSRSKKSVGARRVSRDSQASSYVFADILGQEKGLREYVSPRSSKSIRRTERTYSKALSSLAKR